MPFLNKAWKESRRSSHWDSGQSWCRVQVEVPCIYKLRDKKETLTFLQSCWTFRITYLLDMRKTVAQKRREKIYGGLGVGCCLTITKNSASKRRTL